MSAIAHSHMRAIAPEISSNMRAIAPKGSLLSILVLSIEFLELIGAAGEQREPLLHLRCSGAARYTPRVRDNGDCPSRRLLHEDSCAGRRSRLIIQARCRPIWSWGTNSWNMSEIVL
jgi:hypothetical protein